MHAQTLSYCCTSTLLVDHSEPLLLPLIFAELVDVHVVGIFDARGGDLVDFVVDVAQY